MAHDGVYARGGRLASRQKTCQFHFLAPTCPEGKKFVAATVSQRCDMQSSYRRAADEPVLPPTFYVWIELSTNMASDSLLYVHWAVSLEDAQSTSNLDRASQSGANPENPPWELPPHLLQQGLPSGSFIWHNNAIRTPLVPKRNNMLSTVINLGQPHQCPAFFQFVLYDPRQDIWTNPSENTNFVVPVQQLVAEMQLEAVREQLLAGRAHEETVNEISLHDVAIFSPSVPDVHHIFELPSHHAELDVAIWTTEEAVIIDIITNVRPSLILHWGFLSSILQTSRLHFDEQNCPQITDMGAIDSLVEAWERPDPRLRPPDIVGYSNHPGAVETYFQRGLQGPESSIIQSVQLVFPYDVIFERCLAVEFDGDTEWFLPVLRDSYLSATCGAFPQRLAFVLRSREKHDEWIHNECNAREDNYRFEVCPLTERDAGDSKLKQSGKVIHHQKYCEPSRTAQSLNFEISIPFSEAFKQRLLQEIQRASAQADIHQRFRHAEFCSDGGDSLSQPPSACLREGAMSGGRLIHDSRITAKKVIQPLFSSPHEIIQPAWSGEHLNTNRQSPSSAHPSFMHPISLHALIAPPPIPGTVIYHHSYTLNDPSSKGVAHVLAIEEPGHRHEWKGELLSVIKVHILVSINVPCIIHWGILLDKRGAQWTRPDRAIWPDGTEAFDDFSVDSPMKTDPRTRMCRLELSLPQTGRGAPLGIGFVLRDVMTDRWIADASGKDLYIRTRRDRIPEFWARRWRGPHANLIATLLQEELRLDTPTHATRRYLALQRSVTLYGVDRSDIEYWAWIFVWWRFAHLRIFDWQKHAHSRPWEVTELADTVSLNITSQWRSAMRSRPIIKLLLRHVLCPGPEEDIRRELHSILAGWNLLSIPFYEQWYRKVYKSVGVEDYVVCRGLILMLQTLSVASYHDVVKFHCYPVANHLETASPVIPPCFAFLQSQLSHIASTRARQEDSPLSGDGDQTLTSNSTDFIARHIELQTSRLRLLVDALEDFSHKLQALFFGPTVETALASTRDSITINLKSVLKEICDLRKSLRPPCPRIVSAFRLSRRAIMRELNAQYRLLFLASRGRLMTSPVMTHCTDNRIVRDFILIDHSLDAIQQEALSKLFAYSGHPIRLYDSLFNSAATCCPTCDKTHQPWSDPLALMLPWMKTSGALIFDCPSYTLGCVAKLSLIIGWLLPGLKAFHPSSEEANVLLNDWASLIARVTNASNSTCQTIDPKILVDGLLSGEVEPDFLYLLAAFLRRVERCASRILNLSLIYLSDKIKFLYDCLDESELYTFGPETTALEGLPYPPSYPRPFDGSNPFMELLPFSTVERSRKELGAKKISRDVNRFVRGIIQNSELFWIAVVLTKLNPLLRTLTFVPAWRPLSDARHATGSIVMVNNMDELYSDETGKTIEAFYKPVVLLVRHATGNETVPYNTAGLIVGPTVIERQDQFLTVSPHILSPMALQTRQLSILSATCLDQNDFNAFLQKLQANRLTQGTLAEFILPENFHEILVHELAASPETCSSLRSETTCASRNGGTSASSSSSVTDGDPPGPEDDAALIKQVLDCLAVPRRISPLLPPQTGPILPTLHFFCPNPCSSEIRLHVLPEDALSADSFRRATDSPYLRHDVSVSQPEFCWGAWYSDKHHTPLLMAIPAMSVTLFEKLYGTSRWFLSPKEFTPLVVGARGLGIQLLREIFPSDASVTVPTIAVPFGAFPSTLRDPENHALAEKLHNLLLTLLRLSDCVFNPPVDQTWSIHKADSAGSMGSASGCKSVVSSLSGSETRNGANDMARVMETRRGERILRECRTIIRALKPTRECLNSLADLAEHPSLDDLDKRLIGVAIKDDKMKLWTAIKKVWCSSFTPALLLATRVTGIPFDVPNFAVLIQLMEPVAYSFSLSVSKPSYISFNQDQFVSHFPAVEQPTVYGEITSGLPMVKGELYNGGYVTSGTPLAFRCQSSQKPEILCFSSQSYVLKPRKRGLVLRPDINIPGIGRVMPSAGLVCACLDTPTRTRFEYQKEPLFTDPCWRDNLLNKLGSICTESHKRRRPQKDSVPSSLAIEGVVDLLSNTDSEINRTPFEDTLFAVPTSHLRIKTVALESTASDSKVYSDTVRQHRISLTGAVFVHDD